MKMSLKIVLSVIGPLNGSIEVVLTLKKLNWWCCPLPHKTFCIFAVVVCLYILPEALGFLGHILNLQINFKAGFNL